MNGILLVDKPAGLTSFDVVFQIKKKFNIKKVGHTGTLDPFATGLLIILCGNATKLAFLFNDLDKAYEGTIVFDTNYDTYDITGQIVDKKETPLTDEMIEKAIECFPNQYDQMPPVYSAIKIDGKKAYALAREGKTVALEPRHVNIYQFKKTSLLTEKSCDFYAHVSKGTYIRSVAVDLAQTLDTYGALSALRRLAIGTYDVKEAKNIDALSMDDLIPDSELFKETYHLLVDEFEAKLVSNGVYLDERQIKTDKPFLAVDINNRLLAYYIPVEDRTYVYKPIYFFNMEP